MSRWLAEFFAVCMREVDLVKLLKFELFKAFHIVFQVIKTGARGRKDHVASK
jgi:hypothetical protein